MAGQGEVGDRGRENVYLIDTAKDGQVTAIAEGFDAAYLYVGSDAGSLYFLTTLDAPNGRVIAVDPAEPARSHWKTVIPAESDAIAITETSVTLVDHQLIVRRLHDAHTRVTSYGLDGSPRRELTLPGLGTARGFEGRPSFARPFIPSPISLRRPRSTESIWRPDNTASSVRRMSRSTAPHSNNGRSSITAKTASAFR